LKNKQKKKMKTRGNEKIAILMRTTFVFQILLFLSLKIVSSQVLLLHDPLTSSCIVPGEVSKTANGGKYSEIGWQAINNGDYMLIEVDERAGFEGRISIDLIDIDWNNSNTASGSAKTHFLSMFSNPIADHHFEDGGTSADALWSLRGGMGEDGGPRYKNGFKVLWASKGAKRTEGSDYHEKVVRLPELWVWEHKVYTFTIEWRQVAGYLKIQVNETEVFKEPWNNQISALKYLYIAKSPDFNTFIGPVFSNLRLEVLEVKH
jgi:hypothetical protein